MKYKYLNSPIPFENRKELNDKILYVIDNNKADEYGITQEDIFNAYTGDGGLHGLKYSDYDSYGEYSTAKKEIENGQFFTPDSMCKFIMDCLNVSSNDLIADITFGMGNFFNHCPNESNLYGCELDNKAYRIAKYLYPKANLTLGDIRSYKLDYKMDYIVGNPPFNIWWYTPDGRIISQLYFCSKAAELLKPFGIMAIIVPESFLKDDFNANYIKSVEENFWFLGQVQCDKNLFKNLGVTNYKTKIMFWQKKSLESSYEGKRYSVDFSNYNNPKEIYVNLIKEAQDNLKKNRVHIILELARHNNYSDDFMYKVKKYLYAIESHPVLREKINKCYEYLNKFNTQVKPDDMSWEVWEKTKITENKVITYLKNVLKQQNKKKQEDVIKLVKKDNSFAYKAYSKKIKNTMCKEYFEPVSEIDVINNPENYPHIMREYGRIINRKIKNHNIEKQKFSDMGINPNIEKYLNDFFVFDNENEEEIRLNNIQKHDINLMLQKNYGLLQWEQGSGKTLAGISIAKYRMENNNAFCSWIISPAISIKNNWVVCLDNYGISYTLINKISDIEKIKQGDFVLVTMNILSKYHKFIKRFNRIHNYKVCLVFDESDEITNPSSSRTKATLNAFRKCHYKLLMTGTSTRNNITEFFPQLELAYNCSVNMISNCRYIYQYNKDNELETIENNNYNLPYPAYKKGYNLFSQSFNPEKITVFGVGQLNQDIYNGVELEDLLSRFVITRTFEEVSGKDIKSIIQIPVKFSDEEKCVYNKAINEFYKMRGNYFSSTGNSRKDSMMKLIQQITLLLRISAAPNTIKEYSGDTPVKIKKVLSLLHDMENDIVAIGVRHKIVVDAYADAIKKEFPDRQLFIVTGETTTLAKRRALRNILKNSSNGILLCTQQSLPSSVNFEFVNNVIIPELHYNNSRMSQFYFRFIRYNSTCKKKIYFITYQGSIESNQMQMVLAKEKLNLFMKGIDTNLDEIYNKFGVDYDLMSLLMYREKDEDGHFTIRWGQQNIN